MATPQDLTATYSFIGALMADPVLTPFGNNSLNKSTPASSLTLK
jgi:hypothetical protein